MIHNKNFIVRIKEAVLSKIIQETCRIKANRRRWFKGSNQESNPGDYGEHVIDLAKRLRQVPEADSQEKGEGMRAFKEISW